MKKYIIGFILGAVIFSGITAYAVMQYNASQITYTRNNVDMPLDEVIDDLYDKADEDYVIPSLYGWQSASSSALYIQASLPDLTDYKTIKIGSVYLESGSMREISLRKTPDVTNCSFQNVSTEQICDISNLTGTGYYIFALADTGSLKGASLNNIVLSKK